MDYRNPVYLSARKAAFDRSGGTCQFCGTAPATDAHHWAKRYPAADATTPDDLTALCGMCHIIATTYRRFVFQGGESWRFKKVFEDAVTAASKV